MATAPPNILLLIADDFGVHQLGRTSGGAGFFATPHLDQLAAQGVRFARAYATAPVCSPARASLYTGMHPARLHLTDFIPGSVVDNPPLLMPEWQRGLPVSAITLGDAFKAAGYHTAHFGKWHLAPDYNYQPGRAMDPESQGFDEVFVTRKPRPEADPEHDPHHVQALTARAIEYCTRPRDRPFLCVVAHNSIHRPELAPARVIEKYARQPGADETMNRPVLAAMVEEMDKGVGRLMEALAASGRGRDTLVIFTADHGPVGPADTRQPLRGAKADLYEGGLRVPLLLRWPGRIPTGAVREQPVTGADLFPTVLEVAKIKSAEPVDGSSLWPMIENGGHRLVHDALFWHYPHYHHLGIAPAGAIQADGWKLIEWFEPSLGAAGALTPRCELFNLEADPAETHDLAPTERTHCEQLLGRLRDWRRSVGAQEMRLNPHFDPRQPTRILPPALDTSALEAP
ncbi:MAG: sulfatase [Opitutaceae bacterium]|nr:sulfatase [Opitutaceae bacterium]